MTIVDPVALSDLWWLFFCVGFIWAPKTWTPGELVSAAAMNTNIRDHLNESLRTQTTTLTGAQDDLALDGPFAHVKCGNASALVVSGALVDGGNVAGSRVIVEALDQTVTLQHQNSGSASANRFITDQGADVVLSQFERALVIYDGAAERWRVGKISTGALVQTVGAVNVFPDPLFLIWPAGDAAAPAGAVLTLDGNSALARNTAIPYLAGMSAELKLGTTATVSTKLTYSIFPSLPTHYRGTFVSLGAALRSATAALGKMEIDDGGAAGAVASPFHDGGDAWDWISFTHQFAGDATKLDVSFIADIAAQDASEVSTLFDAVTLILGPSAPTSFIPAASLEGILYFAKIPGEVAVETGKFDFDAGRPFLVRNTSLRVSDPPTDAALIVDVNHWDGSAFQSMYSTKPQIADAAAEGGAEPDGTYRYRCFAGRKNDGSLADALLSVDIDQVGSTNTGEDLQVSVRILQFADPIAALKAY